MSVSPTFSYNTVTTPVSSSGSSIRNTSGKSTCVSNRPGSPPVMAKERGKMASSLVSTFTNLTWKVAPLLKLVVTNVAYSSVELIR